MNDFVIYYIYIIITYLQIKQLTTTTKKKHKLYTYIIDEIKQTTIKESTRNKKGKILMKKSTIDELKQVIVNLILIKKEVTLLSFISHSTTNKNGQQI